MPCCMCEEYGWEDPQEVVYTDPEDGKEYCLFHAPVEHKGVSVDDFNAQVSERIQATMDLEDEEALCDLSGTLFPGKICFDKECVLPDMSLRSCVFVGVADFSEAEFGGDAFFLFAKFGSYANFSSAEFGGCAYFGFAEFGARAYFDSAKFGGYAYFRSAKFGGDADFRSAKFGGYADFSFSQFAKETVFEAITVKDSPDTTLRFSNCTIPTEMLTFQQCDDLSYLDLNDQMDLANIRFHECSWGDNGRIRLRREDKELQPTRDLYQRMKAKYKDENNEYEASKWHVAEKEAQLKVLAQRKDERFNWFMLWLYKLVSGFGENPGRAFGVLTFILVLPLLFSSMDISVNFFSWTFHFEKVADPIGHWLKFIPLTRATHLEPSSGWRAVMFFWQLLITLQAALFAFALRNNFRR